MDFLTKMLTAIGDKIITETQLNKVQFIRIILFNMSIMFLYSNDIQNNTLKFVILYYISN